jgi:hypothetical protein
LTDETETITLWPRTGPEELALVEGSGWREWPPRLPSLNAGIVGQIEPVSEYH